MRNDKDNLIVKLTFELALEIISYSEEIRKLNRFEMASQIFRSGTSIGANIREAQNAESKADFIHKFKISATCFLIFSAILSIGISFSSPLNGSSISSATSSMPSMT